MQRLTAQEVVNDSMFVDGLFVGYDISQCGQMPPVLRTMIKESQKVPLYQRKKAHRLARLRNTRSSYLTDYQSELKGTRIGPLLTTVRSQGAPFNQYCPQWRYSEDKVSSGHCLTGCVATALEQIMTYYSYPETLKDTLHGWTTDNYIIADMLPGTPFNWEKIRNDYRDGYSDEEADAVAMVSLACGMAVNMNYGLESSGASYWYGESYLRDAFGYGTVKLYDRVSFSPNRWHQILRRELEAGHPIAYAGHNMALSGHAFNIDGVDEKGFYHCNWGYNGDYDGWFDLDILNPFEPRDNDIYGISEGFFNNQYMLLLHPDPDVVVDCSDTLDMNNLGIVCDSVRFLREPDCQEYTAVDFYFHNEGEATVTYTYEVMTWLPTDTAIFQQADYVGLAAVTLEAGEHRVWRTFCRFTEYGERFFGLSHDDETIPFQQVVNISQGTKPVLEWGNPDATFAWDDNDSEGPVSATFIVEVENKATDGYAGNLVTYCLRKAGLTGVNDDDQRHWTVLSLAGGDSDKLSITFNGLQVGMDYELWVRCPWTVVSSLSFTTPDNADEAAINKTKPDKELQKVHIYDISGRKFVSNDSNKQLVIQNGKLTIK
ncbi:MAG: C10 family peptidase [Bacteroidaceae bacterium]|nr:C10 family peptidase [Bacteroidaceae bacterium]